MGVARPSSPGTLIVLQVRKLYPRLPTTIDLIATSLYRSEQPFSQGFYTTTSGQPFFKGPWQARVCRNH